MASWRTGFKTGVTTVTSSTNGNATITHGLGVTPRSVMLTMTGDTTVQVDAQAYDANTITCHFKAATDGADVTTGSYAVSWLAQQ